MPSYNKQVSISTYTVDKLLIEYLEDYFKQNVLEILHMQENKEAAPPAIAFSATLIDSHGIEKYNSIREHKFQFFRNDIKGITLEVELKTNDRELKITLRFGDEEENSDLAISLSDENAREKVSAIEQGILAIINHNKNLNRIFFPPVSIRGIALLGAVFCGLFTLSNKFSNPERFGFGVYTLLVVFYLIIIPNYFKGYCSFDTNKQKQLDKWFTWLITGLLGFLLFSTLLTSVRKSLFGF